MEIVMIQSQRQFDFDWQDCDDTEPYALEPGKQLYNIVFDIL